MRKLLILVFIVLDIFVIFKFFKPRYDNLKGIDDLSVTEMSYQKLLEFAPDDTPLYVRLTNTRMANDMWVESIVKGRHYRGTWHRSLHFIVVPVVENDWEKGEPVLTWVYVRKYKYIEDDFIGKWKKAGQVYQTQRYRYFDRKDKVTEALEKAYEKYDIIPVNPEKLYYLEPIINKADWGPFKLAVGVFIFFQTLIYVVLFSGGKSKQYR